MVISKQEQYQIQSYSQLHLLYIDVRTYKLGELLTELCVVAHESLGGRVAVVNPDAALGQQSAYVALAAAYASGDGCAYHCCSMR